MRTLPFWLVDVFAREPLSGNGLSVFLLDDALSTRAMQRITREMRQFETIFLRRTDRSSTFEARIFTMEEELPFAGHPIIGAAALMHSELYSKAESVTLELALTDRTVEATSRRKDGYFIAETDQGAATFGPPIEEAGFEPLLKALNLSVADLEPELPLQVVSTGLPYLVVPIESGLDRARIVVPDFEARLASVGARFVYVFQTNRLEGRTWDNAGSVEDIATGSAAGPAAAYLVRHGRARAGDRLVLKQGRFVDRPSELCVTVHGNSRLRVTIEGQAFLVGKGALRLPDTSLHPDFA